MRISIVTISYNQSPFLEQAINSIIGQDFSDLEYLVVDPGSTDGSREIIERHRSHIGKIIYEPDNGPADGLNKGFAQSSGDVLGFINADDVLLPGAIRRVANWFVANPDCDVMCGAGYMVDAQGKILRKVRPTRFSPCLYAYGAVTFLQQSTFFRRSAFFGTGGFNRDNRTCWDGELFLDMSLNGAKFRTSGEFLASFRVHDLSISGSGRLNEVYQRDNERLFVKAIGRKMRPADKVFAFACRLWKWLTHPAVTVGRIGEMRR